MHFRLDTLLLLLMNQRPLPQPADRRRRPQPDVYQIFTPSNQAPQQETPGAGAPFLSPMP